MSWLDYAVLIDFYGRLEDVPDYLIQQADQRNGDQADSDKQEAISKTSTCQSGTQHRQQKTESS